MLTHLDENNNPRMVNIEEKNITKREAIASGKISLSKEAFLLIKENKSKKGPVLQTAIISAIMGAKQTSSLIPMCHPLMLTSVKCDIEELADILSYKVYVKVKTSGQTGVEMEALTATSIALLTIYDMVKAVDKSMVISNIQLEEKKGGKNGDYKR